jgi:ABC-type transport system involved in multi-copper enzyme maturation permease subunit
MVDRRRGRALEGEGSLLGPIFVREWLTVARRAGHYVMRSASLGVLWILALTAWQATIGWGQPATLGDLARFGQTLFALTLYVQLPLVLFFAGLSAASTIIQEKDRRTFILLLLTRLRNHEIVLGKLLGSLLQIVLLLSATVPMLALLILLGGTSIVQVGQGLLVLASTALAAGSLGALIALWRERTFQALALTVLFLVLYLCLALNLTALLIGVVAGVVALAYQAVWRLLAAHRRAGLVLLAPLALVAAAAVVGAGYFLAEWPWLQTVNETAKTWLHPYWALRSVLEPLSANVGVLAPPYAYALVMLLWSVLLCAWGMLRLRVWNPSGEPIMQREKIGEAKEKDAVEEADKAKQLARATAHAAPGRVRHVEGNPILWREIFTRAYGRRPLLVKLAYGVVLALIGFSVLAPLVQGKAPTSFEAAWGLLPVGVLSLLLVAAQATTAITSERDTGALDLLLVTDLTPREFIFGKLGGILYNTKEYLIPPLLLAVVYAFYGRLAAPPANHKELLMGMNVTSLVCIVGASLVLLIFAMVLGIHVALRTQNSRAAVIHTLSTVFFLSVGTLVCMAIILINRRFEYQWGSFIFFLVAGIGGLWWVLNRERPSAALSWASIFCPLAVLYTVMTILVAKPGSQESADPVLPFLVIVGAFGFTVAAMLVPLLSEFDVAMGRTSGGAD